MCNGIPIAGKPRGHRLHHIQWECFLGRREPGKPATLRPKQEHRLEERPALPHSVHTHSGGCWPAFPLPLKHKLLSLRASCLIGWNLLGGMHKGPDLGLGHCPTRKEPVTEHGHPPSSDLTVSLCLLSLLSTPGLEDPARMGELKDAPLQVFLHVVLLEMKGDKHPHPHTPHTLFTQSSDHGTRRKPRLLV